MATFKVVVTDYVFENFEQEEQVLGAIDAELVVCQAGAAEELKPEVKDADAILNTYLGPIDRDLFQVAEKLRIVVRYGIGLDTINVSDATEFGIMVANVPDYCIDEVADHALSHFLALARKLPLSDRRVKAGEWSLSYLKPLMGIGEMTAGIVGLGRIGRAIARRLQPFGVSVIFADPQVREETDGCRPVTFDALLEESDAIFVQCPSNEATHHLINKAALAKTKKRPILINCARGEIVDTAAVVWALENGKLAGAGLDLLDDEATVLEHDHPLKHFENVILTPHSAWYSVRAIRELQRKGAEEVARGLTGQRPLSLVNPEVVKRS